MQRPPLCAVAVLGLSAALASQNLITSPAGLANVEGDSNHDYILFDSYAVRWQQIDHTHRGTPYTNISSIAFRRDAGAGVDATWTSRNLTNLQIIMAHVDPVTFSPSATNMNGTYKDVPVTTVTLPTLNLPDWTMPTGASPEPFSVIIPFTTGWNYNGTDDFVWEVQFDTNDATVNYGNDFALDTYTTAGYRSTSGSLLSGSTGCIASTDTNDFDITGTFYNHGTHFRLRFGATDCTANETAFLYLGVSDPNVQLPGLCGPIRTDASVLVGIPIGVASATGTVPTAEFDNLPYAAGLQGFTFYGQLLALDLGQPSGIPIVLSDGRSWTMPFAPTATHNCTRLYNYLISSTSTSWTTSGPWYGGIVAGFTY